MVLDGIGDRVSFVNSKKSSSSGIKFALRFLPKVAQ